MRKDKGGKHEAPESKLQAQCIAHAKKQKQGLLSNLIVLNTSSMHGFAGCVRCVHARARTHAPPCTRRQAMRVTGSKGVADLLIFHRGAGNSGALFVEFKARACQLMHVHGDPTCNSTCHWPCNSTCNSTCMCRSARTSSPTRSSSTSGS